MTRLSRKLEKLFIDITFAEEREFYSAKEALKRVAQAVEDTFTAIAFAEAGEFEPARSYINKDGEAPKSHRRISQKRFNKLCSGGA